jgi:uncharacterized membrane protein
MLIHSVLAVIHVLAGAVWLGSMVYSLVVLHPGAHRYFQNETEFEAFIATVSHGARGKVLLGMAVIGVTGIALVVVRWPQPVASQWLGFVGAKTALFVAALCLFCYTSWRLWPARLFAAPEEIARFQQTFRWVAVSMITLAGLSMALGVLLHLG